METLFIEQPVAVLRSNECAVKLPARFYARLLSSSILNQEMLGNAISRDSFGAILDQFLATDQCLAICERLGFNTVSDAMQKISARVFANWLGLWLTYHYPKLAKVYLKDKYRLRYLVLRDIPFSQLVNYAPAFCLYRINSCLEDPFCTVWLRWLANGKNIRHAPHRPYKISKKAAHWMGQAPYDLNFKEAFFYGRLRAMGGSEELFNQLRSSIPSINQIGVQTLDFLGILIRSKQLIKKDKLKELIGYVDHRLQEEVNFKFKGRTLAALIRLSDQWYVRLRIDAELRRQQAIMARLKGVSPELQSWSEVQVKDFEETIGNLTYRIEQICNLEELIDEGLDLQHCVASYHQQCLDGLLSIWSLRRYNLVLDDNQDLVEKVERLVTIELKEGKYIVQAKGKYNRLPNQEEEAFIHKWQRLANLEVQSY